MPTSLRLFSRAPCTRIMSWLSTTCSAGRPSVVSGMLIVSPSVGRARPRGARVGPAGGGARPSGGSTLLPDLLDPDQVARGVAEGAVADAVGLVDRLLDDLGAAGLQPVEDAVEVGGGQHGAGVG